LTHAQRRRLAGMAAAIAALHVVGWGTLIVIVAPQHVALGATAFGVGLGVTAYVLGLRHAFDADHIAAIDNTTRRMLESGQRPVSVGFWFSLGHSSVVFGLALLVALGARSLPDAVSDGHSTAGTTFLVVGTVASAGFLLLLAWLNLSSFVRLGALWRRARTQPVAPARIDAELQRRGLVNRVVSRLGVDVDRPARMYLVGLAFGLGFDTATEIVLLLVTGAGVAAGVPWYAILCLPVLFAAGMSLVDTIDGSLMAVAYGWALTEPVRKLYVNLTMTGLSAVAAAAIAACELIAFASGRLGLDDGWWGWTDAINGQTAGVVIAGLLVGTWLTAVLVWRLSSGARTPAAGPTPSRSRPPSPARACAPRGRRRD
jgi:high-affinity nickel-transport protein